MMPIVITQMIATSCSVTPLRLMLIWSMRWSCWCVPGRRDHMRERGERESDSRRRRGWFVWISPRVIIRECIPGLPFPGCLGIPVIFHSRIPGNRSASFPVKTGTVHLTALLPFTIIAASSRHWHRRANARCHLRAWLMSHAAIRQTPQYQAQGGEAVSQCSCSCSDCSELTKQWPVSLSHPRLPATCSQSCTQHTDVSTPAGWPCWLLCWAMDLCRPINTNRPASSDWARAPVRYLHNRIRITVTVAVIRISS